MLLRWNPVFDDRLSWLVGRPHVEAVATSFVPLWVPPGEQGQPAVVTWGDRRFPLPGDGYEFRVAVLPGGIDDPTHTVSHEERHSCMLHAAQAATVLWWTHVCDWIRRAVLPGKPDALVLARMIEDQYDQRSCHVLLDALRDAEEDSAAESIHTAALLTGALHVLNSERIHQPTPATPRQRRPSSEHPRRLPGGLQGRNATGNAVDAGMGT